MAATTGQLGLVTPTQGTLSGTWGDTVNNGITEYVNIAIAGTLSFAGDGAISLTNTTGTASATNIGSTTAQYMVIRVTGTLTTTKVITGPSYSKIYLVDNAATGGSVTFKASGGTGVTVAAGTRAFVYYNGTDYVSGGANIVNLATEVSGILPVANGGTGTSSTTFVNAATNVTGVLPVANGGNGTATPALTQGANVTITGSWPNYTIAAANPGTGTVTGVTASSPLASSGGTAPNISISSTTGSGAVVLATSPTLVTPALGTPASGNLANCTFPTLNQNTTGSAGSLATTNFSISEVGGVLVFKYGATTIATMDSTGNLTTLNNVTAYGSI